MLKLYLNPTLPFPLLVGSFSPASFRFTTETDAGTALEGCNGGGRLFLALIFSNNLDVFLCLGTFANWSPSTFALASFKTGKGTASVAVPFNKSGIEVAGAVVGLFNFCLFFASCVGGSWYLNVVGVVALADAIWGGKEGTGGIPDIFSALSFNFEFDLVRGSERGALGALFVRCRI